MNNYIFGKYVSNIDDVDTSQVIPFACRPMIGDKVVVSIKGQKRKLSVVSITHTIIDGKSIGIDGKIPAIEVELNKPML